MTPCTACSTANPDTAKFCGQCGAPLGRPCPSCGTTNPPDTPFCMECGAPLRSAAPPSPETVPASGERKQLTVLFADVQGSMDLQEGLDPEVWAEIMGRFVQILAEGVRRFGGTVDKFTGDGIMALFGAPVAQEDHARRACHAAWHLTKAIAAYAENLRRDQGIELHVRLGLNSGEVVVGRVGDDVNLDPTALGHTVGLAHRMEAMAEPGKAYLTEHTARLVEGWFRLEALGPTPVKGAREPVRVYALEGPSPSPPVLHGGQALGTAPLVGRDRELAVLDDALALSIEGHAQVVGVVGEAGVGKSRLCEEFARSAAARGITVRRSGGVSHAQEVPLLPILALLRDHFGVTETDEPVDAREKVSGRVLDLDPAAGDDLPLLLDFLEVPDPDRPAPRLAPEVRMRRIFEALRRLVKRRSEQEVLVLVLEDLHWFDPQSEAFLERLIESYPGSRTLVVANFRPEFSARWMRHSYYRQLPLAPLGDTAVGELLGGLLGVDPSLAPLVSFMLERTGGNPFFMEEVVRVLLEDGTLAGESGTFRLTRALGEVKVPASVHAVLAARIDRLPSDHKVVLQTAAVIGRTFTEPVLARVTGLSGDDLEDALRSLCAAELLQEGAAGPVPEYAFWHPLSQEVAYGSLLSEGRARLHAAVAAALADLDPARQDERASLIATHFEAAGDHLEAARWSARAATWSLRSSFEEGVRYWRVTIAHLDQVAETDEALALGVRARGHLLRLGARTGIDVAEAEALFAVGSVRAKRLADPGPLGLLTGLWGAIHWWRGDLRAGRAAFVEARRLATGSADPDRGVPSLGVALSCIYMGTVEEGLSVVEEAIDLCDGDIGRGVPTVGYSSLVRNFFSRAQLLALAGRLQAAKAEIDRALTLARDDQRPELLGWGLAIPAHLAFLSGDGDSGRNQAVEALRMGEESANPYVVLLARQAIGIAELAEQEFRGAIGSLARSLEEARGHQVGLCEEASALAHLARAHLRVGDAEAAGVAAENAVAVARAQGARVVECLALLTLAQVQRATGGDPEAVLHDLDAAAELIKETGAVAYEPFIREEVARLHGDESELREALRLYTAIGATGHARRLEAELSARPAP